MIILFRDRTSRPTSLAVDTGKKLLRPETVETFPTPMEEPRKICKAWYLGSLQVITPLMENCGYGKLVVSSQAPIPNGRTKEDL